MPLSPPRRYQELVAELAGAAERGAGSVDEIGRSVAGRPIVSIRFPGTHPDGPVTLVIGGLHAMEHVGCEVALELARRCASGVCSWPGPLVIAPAVNPDGYLQVEAGLRWRGGFWRENARGVDLNRNFAVGFSGSRSWARLWGAQDRGSSALSEPETRAVHQLMVNHSPVVFVSLHAFGNVIFTPFARSRRRPSDATAHARVARAMARASGYRTAQLARYVPLFRAFGTELDHAHARGILAFLIEIGAGPRPLSPQTWWPLYRWYTPPPSLLERDRARAVAAVEAISRQLDATTGSAAGR